MASLYDRNSDNTCPNTRKDSQMCFRSSVPMVPRALCASVTQRERAELKKTTTNKQQDQYHSELFYDSRKMPWICHVQLYQICLHACMQTPRRSMLLSPISASEGFFWIKATNECLNMCLV